MKVTDNVRNKIEKFPEGYVFGYDEFQVEPEKESALKIALFRDKLWESLKLVYTSELETMAFKEIPHENKIKKSFKTLIGKLKES